MLECFLKKMERGGGGVLCWIALGKKELGNLFINSRS